MHERTQVTVSGSGKFISPPLVPEAPGSLISSIPYTFLDLSSVADHKPWQRFIIPIGKTFAESTIQSMDVYLALTNLASQPTWDAQHYTVRATCMASEQVGRSRSDERRGPMT